jgi:hypothetical protein
MSTDISTLQVLDPTTGLSLKVHADFRLIMTTQPSGDGLSDLPTSLRQRACVLSVNVSSIFWLYPRTHLLTHTDT